MRLDKIPKIKISHFLIASASLVLSFLGLAYNYGYSYMGLPILISALTLVGFFIYKKRLLLFGIFACIQFILLTFSSYFYFSQVGYQLEAYSLILILIIQVAIMPYVWSRFFFKGIILNSLITFLAFNVIASLISLQFALQNGGAHFQYLWIALVISICLGYVITTLPYIKNSKPALEPSLKISGEIESYIGDKAYTINGGIIYLSDKKIAILPNSINDYLETKNISNMQGYTIIHPAEDTEIKTLKIKDKLRPDMANIEVISMPKNQVYDFINKL